MSTEIKFVAYLSKSDTGSAQFRQHYDRLPDSHKQQIRLLDYNEIKKVYADKCPSWLRGFPCLASYETTPTVWEGSKAIELVARWAAECQQQHSVQSQGGGRGAPPPQQPATEAQSAGPGDFAPASNSFGSSMSCAVVSDDLYQSHMPNKTGSEVYSSSGKITSSDIARYNSARESGHPSHAAAGNMM